jgi:hypothetical protein
MNRVNCAASSRCFAWRCLLVLRLLLISLAFMLLIATSFFESSSSTVFLYIHMQYNFSSYVILCRGVHKFFDQLLHPPPPF